MFSSARGQGSSSCYLSFQPSGLLLLHCYLVSIQQLFTCWGGCQCIFTTLHVSTDCLICLPVIFCHLSIRASLLQPLLGSCCNNSQQRGLSSTQAHCSNIFMLYCRRQLIECIQSQTAFRQSSVDSPSIPYISSHLQSPFIP